jgi:hypothetical protein
MELKIKIIIEILGSPKEHVEKTINGVMEELGKRENKFLKTEVSKTIEVEKFFSAFTDVEFECKDWDVLIDICFDFMPSVVEIIEPLELKFEGKKMEELLNDLLAKLHKNSMITRNLHAENVQMKRELGRE